MIVVFFSVSDIQVLGSNDFTSSDVPPLSYSRLMGASLKWELQSRTEGLGQIRIYNVFVCMQRDKCSAYCKDLNVHYEQYPGCLPRVCYNQGHKGLEQILQSMLLTTNLIASSNQRGHVIWITTDFTLPQPPPPPQKKTMLSTRHLRALNTV